MIFFALMAAGLILLVGGALFGHDHDGGFDHDHDHDSGHDAGQGNEPAVSIFSPKVIGVFILGFGGGGFLARHAGTGTVGSSFIGVGTGLLMGLMMYLVLKLMYGQQATSLVSTGTLVGKTGTVTIGIDAGAVGQVVVRVGTEAPIYLARTSSGKSIAKGKTVRVIATSGSEVVVDEEQ